nr:MAG: replication associated protein [Cressdnaviricota sp.]
MTARRYLATIWIHLCELGNGEETFGIIKRRLESLVEGGDIRFFCGQLERCPNTGREHLQCYFEFDGPVRGSRISKLLKLSSASVRFEKASGTSAENIRYCTKEETRLVDPFQLGTPGPGQGVRSDLESCVSVLRETGSLKRLAEVAPETFVKYSKGFTALYNQIRVTNTQYRQRDVIVRWGPTGVGKTRYAYETYALDASQFYRAAPIQKGAIWFDGYKEEQKVLFDDYGGDGVLPLGYFLQVLDGYEVSLPVKGGFVAFNPKTIIITSNFEPKDWYKGEAEVQIQALYRRITDLVYMPALIQ